MSGPKKTSPFDYLNSRINKNKEQSGYQNIVDPFTVDNVPAVDNEELQSNIGKDNISADVLDYLKTSSSERKAQAFQQSETVKLVEKQEKEDLDTADKEIKKIDDQIKKLETGVQSEQSKSEVEQLKVQKNNTALAVKDNGELDKINQKISSIEKPYLKETDNSWFGTEFSRKIADFIGNGLDNLHNTFTNPENKMKPQEKAEYQQLKQKRDTYYKPIADQKALDWELVSMNLDMQLSEDNLSLPERWKIKNLRDQALDKKRELEAYINGEDGADSFFRKLGGISYRTNDSKGAKAFRPFSDLVDNVFDFAHKDDLYNRANEGYENLSDHDRGMLEVYTKLEEDDAFLSDKQKWSYGVVEQTTGSVGFIRDMYLGGQIAGSLGAMVGLGEGTALTIARGATRALGSKAAGRFLAGAVKAGDLATNYAIQSQINPQFINAELMKGSHIERDEDGKITNIYVKDKLFDYMGTVYDQTAKVYQKEKADLEKKGNLNVEDQDRLDYLKVKLGETNDLNEHSLQEELETFRPASLMEAEVKGFLHTSTENIAELYTGKILGGIGKGLNKIPGINKLTTKIASKLEGATTAFNGSKIGRLYKGWNNGVGKLNINGNRVIGSIPEEIAEEYFTSAMNSTLAADPKEFIDMFDTQANIDIAAQTLLMSAGFGIGGNVQTHTKVAYNKLINKRLEELKPTALQAQEKFPQLESLILSQQEALSSIPKGTPEYDKLKGEINSLEEDKAKQQAVVDKFNSFKDNPSLTGLNIMKNIPGVKDSTFSATANYVKGRKDINNTINSLRNSTEDKDIQDIINLGTTSGFGVSEQKLKVDSLRAEGKTAEANLAEKAMFQNLVLQSFRGDVHKEFKSALDKIQYKEGVSEETKVQALKAAEQVEALTKTYEFNKSKPNLQNIMTLAVEKLSAKEGLQDLESDKANIANDVKAEIDAFRAAKGITVDYSLNTLFSREFDNPAEQDKYDSFLKELSDYRNTMIDSYMALENSSEMLGKHLNNTALALSEAIHPSLESVNSQKFTDVIAKDYQDVIEGNVNSPTAQFNYNNQFTPSEEFIEEVFNNRRAEWVGKTMDGKISQTEFDKLKNRALTSMKFAEKQKEIQQLMEMQTTTDQANAVAEESSEFEMKDSTQVADTVGEEEFSVAVANVEDDSALFFDLPSSPNVIITDEEFDTMIEGMSYTPEQLAFVKKAMYDITTRIQSVTGQDTVTFKEAMSQYYKYFKDKKSLKDNFSHFARGWKENGYALNNGEILDAFDSLFNIEQEVFSVEEGIKNLFASVIPVAPEQPVLDLDDKVNAVQQEIAQENTVSVTLDEENLPVPKTAIEEVKTQRTLNILPKLAFNAISYTEEIEDGIMVRKSTSSTLNIKEDDLIDFRDLINPDMYPTGSTLKLEVASENLWSTISVSNGRTQAGKMLATPFSEWVAAREAINPDFRNTQEFRNKVPVFYTSETGKRLAYVQDTDWYTPYNVANPFGDSNNPNFPTPEWADYISQGRNNTQNLRDSIANGLETVTVTRPNKEGIFHKLLDNEPLISLQESNPQSIVRVQRGEVLDNLPEEFHNGQSVLLNKPEDFNITQTNGHTWSIYRIGTSPNDKGDMVKTYRAFPINRQVTLDQVENVRWALAAHSAYVGNSLPFKYRMTKEQALDMFIKPLAKSTGLNISDPRDLMDYIKSYFQLSPNAVYDLRRPTDKKAYNADSTILYLRLLLEDNNRLEDPTVTEMLSQHTNSKLINSSFKAVELSKTGVAPVMKDNKPVSYEQYLKDTLLINIKAFNVGTESKPMYTTVVQPIINVEYAQQEVAATPVQERVQQAIQEAIAEVLPTETVSLQTHLDFLKSINVDLELFESQDDLIENTDKLANLFNVVGNLNISQENTIRQYIVHALGEKISFDYKTKINRTKLSNEIKSEVNLIVRPIKANITKLLADVKDSNIDKAQTLTDAYTHLLDSIKSIQDNFEDFFDKAFTDIKQQTQLIEVEEEIAQEENEETLSIKDYTKDSIEESGKSKASYRLRRFLHKIPQYDNEGKPVTGFFGFAEYMTFNDVYNELTKVLSMGSEVTSDYNNITGKMKESKSPFVKDILAKLENADQQIKNEFTYNFVRHTLSSKFAMFSNEGGTSLKIFDTNSNEIGRIIKSKWLNESKASDLYRANGSFNTEYAEALVAEFNTFDKDVAQVNKEDLKKWLQKVGMYVDNSTWDDLVSKGIYNSGKYYSFKELYSLNKGGIFLNIVSFLKEGIKTPDNYAFSRDVNLFSDLGGVTNAIANIEAQYNPQLIALSYRDSGKNISTQVPTKYVTDMVQELKRSVNGSSTLIDDLQSLSFSENSIILNLLKNDANFKSLFEISHVGLTAIKEKGTKPTRAGLTDLGEIDYDMMTLAGFQDRKIEKLAGMPKIDGMTVRMANMLFPTMSDKSTGLMLKTAVFDIMKDSELLFTKEGDTLKFEPSLSELLFNNLVLPELKRIIKFHSEVKRTNIKNYDKAATIFHFLPVMNTIKAENGISLIKELACTENYTLDQIVERYRDQIYKALEDVVTTEVNYKKALWKDYTEPSGEGVSSPMFDTTYFSEVGKIPNQNYDVAVYDYVINSMIFNAEVFKVFAGDIANYSQDKVFKGMEDMYKAKQDTDYISINKQIGINLGKRLALLIAPGNKIANSYNEMYNQIMLQDSVDITENANYLIGLYYGQEGINKAKDNLAKYAKAASILDRYEQGEFFINPENLNRVKNMLDDIKGTLAKDFPRLDGYFDIESTDAQEYSTATEHTEMLYRMGRLSDKDYQAIITKMSNTGVASYLTKRELKLVLQPVKPVSTGTQVIKEWDVNRVIYIKSSSFPLLPQFTAGTKLDALRLKMEQLEGTTGRFTRASFQTANKVGATKNTVNPFDINSLEKIKEYSATDLDSTVLVLNRNNFRIQQDVPFKSDKKSYDTVSMGTQFFKLLFGDNVINQTGFIIAGKTYTGKELYAHYSQAFETIVQSKVQELFIDLGLSPEGQVTNQATFVNKLQALLTKEATDRGYSIKSIRGLSIEQVAAKAGFYYEFKTPLWLSSDSNRYESLLNSIITNRLMKHKLPGNSFVAGSESGLKMKEGLKGIDTSKIIFLEGFNDKELQGVKNANGIFSKAQVLMPSKFKNSEKELIDLFENYTEGAKEGKYIKKNADGKLMLKTDMIDPELLNNFSFRTPTSSHVSGSTIEIVGFLPSEMGDLVIVPKNFTKQKGLDFDVDKESAYQLNHIVDEAGRIKVLDKEYAESKKAKIQEIIDSLDLENTILDRKLNFREELLSLAQEFSFFEDELPLMELLDPASFTTEVKKMPLREKLSKMSLEFDRKLAENEFIRTHLAVFNNPSDVIQSKINQILSIDFAREQADKFEALNEEGHKNAKIQEYLERDNTLSLMDAEDRYKEESLNFSMLNYTYQKQKMSLGSIGKVAIGVYANYTTFNGLVQQAANKVYIPIADIAENKQFTIGSFKSSGILGAERTLDGARTIAEVFAEKENTATDNEKEQVLGRVGVNESTINVDAHLTLRGFDKDENGNSISYLLLSQPAVKQLNERRKTVKGILGDYKADGDIINEMIQNLTNGMFRYVKWESGSWNFELKSEAANTTDGNSEGFIPFSYNGDSSLTGTNMLQAIKDNGSDKGLQADALMSYVELEKEARGISKIQRIINTNTLGKSMIESQLKYDDLKELPTNNSLAGATALLGDYKLIEDTPVRPEGYMIIGDFYVKPTTPQGQIVLNGLHYGNTLYKDFFPYQDGGINVLVKEVVASQGKSDLADSALVESFESILEEVKKYIYSRKDNNIFTDNAREKRFELFKDTEVNTSLSTYMKNLLRGDVKGFGRGIKTLKNNSLVKSFTYETGKGQDEISLIKYNNAATDNLNEESLYNSIPELILLNAPLPDRNGKAYSTKLLAEDLVSYAHLEGGIQEATQFIKFIPVEYLETVGKYEETSVFKNGEVVKEQLFVPANRKLQAFNPKRNEDIDIFAKAFGFRESEPSIFTVQYFQHNPDKAAKTNYKKVTNYNQADGTFVLKPDEVLATFLSVRAPKNSKLKEKYTLYQHLGNRKYKRVPLLGQMGISEYDYRNADAVSIKDNEITRAEMTSAPATSENPATISNDTTKGTLEQISKLTLAPGYEHLPLAAAFLAPVSNVNPVLFDSSLNAAASATRDTKTITINPLLTTAVSNEKFAMVFLHEAIHTLTAKEVSQYLDPTGTQLRQDMTIPSYVTDLFNVFSEFRKEVRPELDVLLNKIAKAKDNSLGTEYTDREKNLIYAGANLREFLAVSLTSPMFMEEMNRIPYKLSGKSLFGKLSDVVMNMLSKIFPTLKQDSIAYNAVEKSLTFIAEENKGIEVQKMEIPSAEAVANVDSDNLMYQPLPTEQLPDTGNADIENQGEADLGSLMIDNVEDLLNLPDCI